MVVGENVLQCKEISDWGTLTVFNRSISLGLLSRKKPNSQQDFVSKTTNLKIIFELSRGGMQSETMAHSLVLQNEID